MALDETAPSQYLMTNEEAFAEFLRCLDRDSPSIERTYQITRQRLVKFFQWRRCSDPEELADETIKRFIINVKGLNISTIKNPSAYLYTFARNVYRESVRREIKDENLAEELQDIWPKFVGEQEDCRKSCLQELDQEDAELIFEYYSSKQERKELVASRSLNLNWLRVRIHRIKIELRACYEECLKKPNAK